MRARIDGFTLTPEVYTRANSILLAKSGKLSEVAAARIQCMTSLPFFSNSSLNNLRDTKVYERLTLDKLPEFMGDFVRLDDE